MKINIILYTLLIVISINSSNAQSFPPGAGFSGTTAVHCDSSAFVDWAISSEIVRGFLNSAFPENGIVEYGFDTNATGKADGNEGVVSLGDGGCAVLTFNYPIVNGIGNDFAVFENGFYQNDTSEKAFLELAFVEVSTDGIEYIRFPSVSEIQHDVQTGSYENLNARMINNLAGKYTMFFGTPFDLEQIKNRADGTSVNVNEINYVKIIDVVGSINDDLANYDSRGNKINDPYPTPFISGGFDLDALGVINNTQNNSSFGSGLFIVQNPVADKLKFTSDIKNPTLIEIFSTNGNCIRVFNNTSELYVNALKPGIYLLKVSGNSKSYTSKFMKF